MKTVWYSSENLFWCKKRRSVMKTVWYSSENLFWYKKKCSVNSLWWKQSDIQVKICSDVRKDVLWIIYRCDDASLISVVVWCCCYSVELILFSCLSFSCLFFLSFFFHNKYHHFISSSLVFFFIHHFIFSFFVFFFIRQHCYIWLFRLFISYSNFQSNWRQSC